MCSNNSRSMALKYPWTLLMAVLSLGVSQGQTFFPSPPDSVNGSDKKPTNQQFSSIDYSLYHHSDTLLEEVKALVARHPDKMSPDEALEVNKNWIFSRDSSGHICIPATRD